MTKSSTCFSKRTGKPLTEYESLEEADGGAQYANDTYGNELVPYQCTTCCRWHLSPKDRQTRTAAHSCCDCVDSDGCPKEAYETREGATRRAQILQEEDGVRLKVYRCRESGLWHLTHQTQDYEGFSSRKSPTCTRADGQKFLTEYPTIEDANRGSQYVQGRYDKEMEPSECPDCGKWHLSPWKAKPEVIEDLHAGECRMRIESCQNQLQISSKSSPNQLLLKPSPQTRDDLEMFQKQLQLREMI